MSEMKKLIVLLSISFVVIGAVVFAGVKSIGNDRKEFTQKQVALQMEKQEQINIQRQKDRIQRIEQDRLKSIKEDIIEKERTRLLKMPKLNAVERAAILKNANLKQYNPKNGRYTSREQRVDWAIDNLNEEEYERFAREEARLIFNARGIDVDEVMGWK